MNVHIPKRVLIAIAVVVVICAPAAAYLIGRGSSPEPAKSSTTKARESRRSVPGTADIVDQAVASVDDAILRKAGYTAQDAQDWKARRGQAWNDFKNEFLRAYLGACQRLFPGDQNSVTRDGVTFTERQCGDGLQKNLSLEPGNDLVTVVGDGGVVQYAFREGGYAACSWVSVQFGDRAPVIGDRRISDQYCIDHFEGQ